MIHWTKNAEFMIEGTQLHIVVELDKDKVRTGNLHRDGRERVSSVIKKIANTPIGPVTANVSVRTLVE